MPSRNTCGLTWVSLTLEWGVSSRLLQQSAAAAPCLGRGVSSCSHPDLERGAAPLSRLVRGPLQPLRLCAVRRSRIVIKGNYYFPFTDGETETGRTSGIA